jgi:HD-GYP domain-containing protein (c-di-GMP phosphodiesterase class II)
MLESMADTIDLRDPYTGGHSQRVAEMTAGILRAMDMSGPEVELIVSAARVHDIGKIGVPDYILNKPGRLTLEEEAIMNTHPDRGADLLQRYPDFARGAEIIRHHHESWDGTGYPQGLKATGIPFGARVIAVADSYDAMTSDRPYRKAMPQAKAALILHEGRGKQWDPQIVDAFLQSIEVQVEPASASASAPSLQSASHLLQVSSGA